MKTLRSFETTQNKHPASKHHISDSNSRQLTLIQKRNFPGANLKPFCKGPQKMKKKNSEIKTLKSWIVII